MILLCKKVRLEPFWPFVPGYRFWKVHGGPRSVVLKLEMSFGGLWTACGELWRAFGKQQEIVLICKAKKHKMPTVLRNDGALAERRPKRSLLMRRGPDSDHSLPNDLHPALAALIRPRSSARRSP